MLQIRITERCCSRYDLCPELKVTDLRYLKQDTVFFLAETFLFTKTENMERTRYLGGVGLTKQVGNRAGLNTVPLQQEGLRHVINKQRYVTRALYDSYIQCYQQSGCLFGYVTPPCRNF